MNDLYCALRLPHYGDKNSVLPMSFSSGHICMECLSEVFGEPKLLLAIEGEFLENREPNA